MRAKDKILEVDRGMGSRHKISSKLAMGTVLGEGAAAAAAEAETKGAVVEVAGIGRSSCSNLNRPRRGIRSRYTIRTTGCSRAFPKSNDVKT
jgi:hypothetical protein